MVGYRFGYGNAWYQGYRCPLSPRLLHEVEVRLEGLSRRFLDADHVGVLAEQVLPHERLSEWPHPVLLRNMRLVALCTVYEYMRPTATAGCLMCACVRARVYNVCAVTYSVVEAPLPRTSSKSKSGILDASIWFS